MKNSSETGAMDSFYSFKKTRVLRLPRNLGYRVNARQGERDRGDLNFTFFFFLSLSVDLYVGTNWEHLRERTRIKRDESFRNEEENYRMFIPICFDCVDANRFIFFFRSRIVREIFTRFRTR